MREGADFSFENGEIKHCGEPDTEFREGMRILADGSVISGTTFSNNAQNLYLECDGAQITGNEFKTGSRNGVLPQVGLRGQNLVFEENTISESNYLDFALQLFSATGSFSNNNITSSSGAGVLVYSTDNSEFNNLKINVPKDNLTVRVESSESNSFGFDELQGKISVYTAAVSNQLDLTAVGSTDRLDVFDATSEGTTIVGGKYSEIKPALGDSTGNVLVNVEFGSGESYEFGGDGTIAAVKDSEFLNSRGVVIDASSQLSSGFEFSGNEVRFPVFMPVGHGLQQDGGGVDALVTVRGAAVLENNDVYAGDETAYYFDGARGAKVKAGITQAKRLAYFKDSDNAVLEGNQKTFRMEFAGVLKKLFFAECDCLTSKYPGLGWKCIQACPGETLDGVRTAEQQCKDEDDDETIKEVCRDAYGDESRYFEDECVLVVEPAKVKQWSC
ncbi:hypothetical protein COU38_02565, partial [Candidatus Micrarchaeota archaeon CG10_big_fil_rev_8_21_14_0_10_54_18]